MSKNTETLTHQGPRVASAEQIARSTTWTREQIQTARRTLLEPILRRRGYGLRAMPNDNFLVEDEGDLLVKESYWVWNSKSMQGNAIDFFMLVECRSFHEAMQILAQGGHP